MVPTSPLGESNEFIKKEFASPIRHVPNSLRLTYLFSHLIDYTEHAQMEEVKGFVILLTPTDNEWWDCSHVSELLFQAAVFISTECCFSAENISLNWVGHFTSLWACYADEEYVVPLLSIFPYVFFTVLQWSGVCPLGKVEKSFLLKGWLLLVL